MYRFTHSVRIVAFVSVAFALAACGGHSGGGGAGTSGGLLPAAGSLSSSVTTMAASKPCFYPNPCTLAEWTLPGLTAYSPSSNPNSIVAGPDGALWFTEWIGNKIGRITTAGAITEFSNGISPNSDPSIIKVGPDGNLWFSESIADGSRSAVAKITTSGGVTEYSAGINPAEDPYGITKGPDGNIWFVGAFDGEGIYKLAPLDTTPTAKVMAHATPGSQSNNMIVGPGPLATDSYLWFAETGGGRIGRYDITSGDLREFPVPTSTSQPYDIVVGPDGNIWFSEYAGGAIGRITPDGGSVVEFKTGFPAGSGPNGITVGSDGNIWFVDANLGALGSLNPLNPTAGGHEYVIPPTTANGGLGCVPSSTVTCPAGPFPIFITTGSDGNLWFTEYNNVIGRVNPLTVTATWAAVGATATPPPTTCESDKDDQHQKPGKDNQDHEVNKPWKDCLAKKLHHH